MRKLLLGGAAVVVLGLAALTALGADDRPYPARATEACGRQYGAGSDQAQRCADSLVIEHVLTGEAARMERARDEAQ